MDTLPPELLSKILLYLPPMDRLKCSLVCRRWAETMTSSQLLHDVWLDIAGFELEAARSVLVNSRRQYTRLALYEADLSKFDSEFWTNIGADLRVLELEECSWSTDVFYAILQKFSTLESLKIAKFGKTSIDEFVPPEGVCKEQLRESLSHLRHLNLDIELTVDILNLLLGLMSNVTSIYLSSFLDENSDFLERLPSVLERNGITRTGADFRGMYDHLYNEHAIKFVDGFPGTLEELRINAEQFTGGAIDAIVRCTKLRSLTLIDFMTSSLSDLVKLLSNLPPDLEILKLENSLSFEIEDMVPLVKLKKLRTFSAISPWRQRFTHESLRRLEGMSTLVNLHLDGFDVDSGVMKRLGCLKNLRTLELRACPDSGCFEAICKNFGQLTELHLGQVVNLTDADGSKLCGFKELRCLSFFHGFGLTDETFKRGVGSRDMKSLSIIGCAITEHGLRSLASHHNRFERFTLFSCPNITSAGVLDLLRNEPRLKWFSTDVHFLSGTCLRYVCPRYRGPSLPE